MIKFDCGRAPVLEKRVKREPDEADRTEAKAEGLGVGLLEFSADLDARCPSKLGGGGGVHPATFVFWTPASPLEGRRGGQHPFIISAPSADHL